jgi:hypothetical protein
MSWQIGAEEESKQTLALKAQFQRKGRTFSIPHFSVEHALNSFMIDAECADLRTQLIKRGAELDEIKFTLDETLDKVCFQKTALHGLTSPSATT